MKQSLYDSFYEQESCGIGAVVDINGRASHGIVSDALTIAENMEHRAGTDATGETGDGVGIMLQIPHDFFASLEPSMGIQLGEPGSYGVGMLFLSRDELQKNKAMSLFKNIAQKEGLRVLAWREVPVQSDILSRSARETMPRIYQVFVKDNEHPVREMNLERKLYMLRAVFEKSQKESYVVSLSSRTIVYKGLFLVDQLRRFYSDLQSELFASAIGIVHVRFSTGTKTSWKKVHPFRVLANNGVINTIRGNIDKMLAREDKLVSDRFGMDPARIFPIVDVESGDSANLDRTVEYLMMSGMPLPLALMVCIPEPWSRDAEMHPTKRDFYEYHAMMMEPWDGPAAILFSDGELFGAMLDRNGLRSTRYYLTNDDRLILSSEVGVLDIDESTILRKHRLQPGKMLLVDMKNGRLTTDESVKRYFARREPFGRWLSQNLLQLKDLPIPNRKPIQNKGEYRNRLLRAFSYDYEDLTHIIFPMALHGRDGIESMGLDRPPASLSETNQPLFYYFKQQFAQVANPPLDAIREDIVTDTTIFLGKNGSLLDPGAKNCRMLKVQHPILTAIDVMKIRYNTEPHLVVAEIDLCYYKSSSLNEALDHLLIQVEQGHQSGASLLILSDRGVDENRVAIPSLLAVSAVQSHLVRMKKRSDVSIIVETGEARTVHDMACLMGYGASAIHPYLAHDCISWMVRSDRLYKVEEVAIEDYNQALLRGITNIAAKMGISTVQSYIGTRLFEALGIHKNVIDAYFPGTVSRIGGMSLADIGRKIETAHNRAFDPLGLGQSLIPDSQGFYFYRAGGEEHLYDPFAIQMLQDAVKNRNFASFRAFSKHIDDSSRTMHLRSLLDIRGHREPLPLHAVESVNSIVKHFKTSAMSYGSISEEAHETLTIAMNRLGAMSNCGEGGERSERFSHQAAGSDTNSAIKQVASARFGVTSEYLSAAKEIQIKIAQGAKPGEGGHLPGKKVYPWIAQTRLSTPGVELISPPPNHDIYSFEDLAQLIHDLKNANPLSTISVKLVAEMGVGNVACGVAKAGADKIMISGYNGGTGAAPHDSIVNAGLPWELGLAEARQALEKEGLLHRVMLETDGKLLTGRDVAIASLLGASAFGFATGALVSMGCVMTRACERDSCPTGIATQNPRLRDNFKGKPEYVMNFMRFVAQELREIMAELGYAKLEEMTGQVACLVQREDSPLDLSAVLYREEAVSAAQGKETFRLEETADSKVLIPAFRPHFRDGIHRSIELDVRNTDRSLGTYFGYTLTKGMVDPVAQNQFEVEAKGHGGLSFGAFLPYGAHLRLTGDSNDFFGKGLSGGMLSVRPDPDAIFEAGENVIIGNGALYGATSGEAFINGIAGERFAVRNSGANAVVEGVGDHGCEYMTGGNVLILGKVGKNFAAGMSGGIVFVWDEEDTLYHYINRSLVHMYDFDPSQDDVITRPLLEKHVRVTGSELGKRLLDDWERSCLQIKCIIPKEYRSMLQRISYWTARGLTEEGAGMKAFYDKLGGEE